jgi:hypothetical protein
MRHVLPLIDDVAHYLDQAAGQLNSEMQVAALSGKEVEGKEFGGFFKTLGPLMGEYSVSVMMLNGTLSRHSYFRNRQTSYLQLATQHLERNSQL